MILKDSYWQPISKELFSLFKEIYFDPIFELLKEPYYNSSNSLLSALNRGQIILQDGVISGKFSIAISKELSKFATFDARSKTFKVKNKSLIPNDILTSSIRLNEKSKNLHEEIKRRLEFMSARAQERFKTIVFPLNKTADEIESILEEEYKKLGIVPNIQPEIRDKLIGNYNENMKLSIVDENNPGNWNNEQVTRLRSMVEKSAINGYNRKNLIKMIQNEFNTSEYKAKFLARQETSLFLSEYRDQRYISAGLKYYQWSTSHDIRVVGNPQGLYPKGNKGHHNHFVMQGMYCKFSDSSVYAETYEDLKNGIWKSRKEIGGPNEHPGREFLCRCRAKPIIL